MRFTGISRLPTFLATPLLALGLGLGSARAAERAIIVLDASGSMWGQIDGKAKISIARETLRRVLGTLPKDTELGLLAYGHRKKGECSDIELIVPAGSGTTATITDAVDALQPKGKTPLSESVRQAADALRYSEERATVILITDGLETCDADPCALGRMLEETGVDFTAHVVGFGLSDQEGREVACLATETGGVYLQAGNAEELVDALGKTVAAAPPPPPEAALTAPPAVPMTARFTIGWTGPGAPGDQIRLVPAGEDPASARVLRRANAGADDAGEAEMDAPGIPGSYLLRYYSVATGTAIAERPLVVTPIGVSVAAIPPVEAGSTFTVQWTGPGRSGDRIELWDPDARGGEGKRLAQTAPTRGDEDKRQVDLTAPAEGGSYELRYVYGRDDLVLASAPVEVVAVEVTLEAPGTIPAGKTFSVVWDGPGEKHDAIQIWDPRARGGEGKRLRSVRVQNADFENRTVSLPAPATSGEYLLRYWSGTARAIMATRPISVTEAQVSLVHDEAVDGGATFTVTWQGPGARYDEIQIFDPEARGGDGKRLRATRLRNGDFDNRQVKLVAPVKPGTYQLRYYNGDSAVVMATSPIVVREVAASLEFASPAPAGSPLVVKWQGPGARFDEIQIWDATARGGDGKRLSAIRLHRGDLDNRTVKLVAPVDSGSYEVRYYNGDSRVVMVTSPLEVTEVAVGLEFPAEVDAGANVTVTWTGPGGRFDEVQVWDTAAKGGDGKRFSAIRLHRGDLDNRTVKLVVPADPGTYEMRYYSGDGRKTMAAAPIVVRPVALGLDAPDQIGQGGSFTVTWQGPGARYDEVQLWDPEAKAGKGARFSNQRVRSGDYDNRQVKLVAPVGTGTKELRYYSGDSRKVLVTRPIEVTPIEIGLDAPDAVEVETRFGVIWKGPGGRYDEIQIVDQAGKKVASSRLRSGDFDNNKLTIKAPKAPGDYVLRYYNGDSRAVLAERPLAVN